MSMLDTSRSRGHKSRFAIDSGSYDEVVAVVVVVSVVVCDCD